MANGKPETSHSKADLALLGITHSKVDQSVVDGFRYGRVQDAIDQARRTRAGLDRKSDAIGPTS